METLFERLQKELPTLFARHLSIKKAGDGRALTSFLLERFKKVFFRSISRSAVCVFSLTEREDLLSQWRGYCPPSGGYSIGFGVEFLEKIAHRYELSIAPCIYDPDEQTAILWKTVYKLWESIATVVFPGGYPGERVLLGDAYIELYDQFYVEFSRVASTLKHPQFNEECEWRIISPPLNSEVMEFRDVNSMLVPYFPIPLTPMEIFPIDEIIIGPMLEQELAESSLTQFLLRNNLSYVKIKKSATPYRPF